MGGAWNDSDVLICQGDSSSATGWITRSSFGDECPLHLAIARSMARYLMVHELSHYSQWFPGKSNSVADALSRDFRLDDAEIVSRIRSLFTHQIPSNFALIQLPQEMITSVGCMLRLLPKSQHLPSTPTPSGQGVGSDTKRFSKPSGMATTPSLAVSARLLGDSSFLHALPRQSVKGGPIVPESLLETALDVNRAQLVPPSTGWHRPIGLTNLLAQSTTVEDASSPFWQLS